MDDKMYSSPVFTLIENSSIHDALLIMKTNFIKRVVIVREKKPVGIITERDINAFLEQDTTARALDEIRLKEIMKKNVNYNFFRPTRLPISMRYTNGHIQNWFHSCNR